MTPASVTLSPVTSDLTIPSRGALLRDLMVFLCKVWLDGLKDVVLTPVAIGAVVLDLGFRTRLFYRVLGAGERFDLWLNLFGAASRAGNLEDGLFGASRAGSHTLLGRLEQAAGGDHRAAAPPPRAR